MPKRTIALTAATRRSGRVGARTPAPTRVLTRKTVFWTRPGIDMGHMFSSSPVREPQAGRRLAGVDEPVHVLRPARVEVDVALADRRLLQQQAGFQQRLPDVHGECAVVAGEAAREVGELRVVAAPLAHPGQALEDAAGDAARRVRVLVRARVRVLRAEDG